MPFSHIRISRLGVFFFFALLGLLSPAWGDTYEDLQANDFRRVISLNGEWSLTPPQRTDNPETWKDDPVFQAGWTENRPLAGARPIAVPLNLVYPLPGQSPIWEPADPIPPDPLEGWNELWGRGAHGSQFFQDKKFIVIWYRRDFEIPRPSENRRIRLYFAGAGNVVEVFLNGKYLGRHDGVFTSFSFDVTDSLREGANTLAVRCILRQWGERLCHWANTNNMYMGLWQEVWLQELPAISVDRVLIDPDPVHKKISYRLRLTRPCDKALQVITEVFPVTNATSASATPLSRTTNSLAPQRKEGRFDFDFSGPCWTPQTPNLLEMKITLREEAKEPRVLDEYRVRFGFRAFQPVGNQLLLNGKPYRLIGYGEDGNHFGGEGYPGSAVFARYEALCRAYRKTGANGIRWHNPVISEQVRAADEVGLGVYPGMNEAPGLAADMGEEYWSYLRKYVEQYYNHPSILMWHFSNEDWEDQNVPLMKQIYQHVKAVDTSGRPVVPDSGSYSFSHIPTLKSSQDVADVHNYTGVSVKAFGGEQRLPFTRMQDVMAETLRRVHAHFGLIPVILGECPAQTVWEAVLPQYWQGKREGSEFGKPIGPDGLVRPEVFEEIQQYTHPWADIGHGVKQLGMVNYMGNPGVEAGHLDRWTSAEVVKRCMEQNRLLPVAGMFINQGEPRLYKLPEFLMDRNAGCDLFAEIAPIAVSLPRQIFAGERVTFDVFVDNNTPDVLNDLALVVRVDPDSAKAEPIFTSPRRPVPSVPPCENRRVPAELRLGEDADGPVLVRLLLYRGDQLVGENLYYASVTPPVQRQPVTQRRTLGVWRPEGQDVSATLSVLNALKIRWQPVTTSDLQSGKATVDWLLVPAGAASREGRWNPQWTQVQRAVAERVRAGMNLLVLEQEGEGVLGIATGMQYVHRSDNITADPVVFDHPVLAKVPWHKWWIWRGNAGDIAPYVLPVGRNSLVVVGAHQDDRVYAVLSEGVLGKGRVILSQADAVPRWGRDAAATLYLRELLEYCLAGEAWKRLGPWSARSTDFKVEDRSRLLCVDLRPYFNQTWSDETPAGDGKGGWTDEGANDFSHFDPPRMDPNFEEYQQNYDRQLSGKAWILGLPFDIPTDGAVSKSCIVVGVANSPKQSKKIVVRQKVERIFFLGTATCNGQGRFIIHYDDGTEVAVPTRFPDWWSCSGKDDVRVAWQGRNPKFNSDVCCFIQPWDNPHSDKTIWTIDLEGDHVVLLAVTLYRTTSKTPPDQLP